MPHKNQTAGVILAAGMSLRFGRPKQLLKLKHKHMLAWVLDAALASHLARVVLVLGNEHRKILQTLGAVNKNPRLQIVINHAYTEGQSRSVKVGLLAVRKAFSSVMFLLGDQPLLQSATINYLLHKYWQSTRDICVPVCRGKRGNPTVFGQTMYERLMTIEGDKGAKEIIQQNPDRVLYVEVDDPGIFIDIDDEGDFEKLRSVISS
jgi:molybdenum cofactor cytidylyltransferase